MSMSGFCCDEMKCAVEADDEPIVHVSKFREIGVRVLDGGSSYVEFRHCPWCGRALPESLRDRWFDELERLGIAPWNGEVPVEYTDHRWYTKRPRGDG